MMQRKLLLDHVKKHLKQKNIEAALIFLDKAHACPHPFKFGEKEMMRDIYLKIGRGYYSQDQYQKTIHCYEKVIEFAVTKNDYLFYLELIHCYKQKKDFFGRNPNTDKAINLINYALELYPDKKLTLYTLSLEFFVNTNRLDDIIKIYNIFIANFKINAKYFRHRGLAYYQKGDTTNAIQDFLRALKLNPCHGVQTEDLQPLYQCDILSEIKKLAHKDQISLLDQCVYQKSSALYKKMSQPDWRWLGGVEQKEIKDYLTDITYLPKVIWILQGPQLIAQGKLSVDVFLIITNMAFKKISKDEFTPSYINLSRYHLSLFKPRLSVRKNVHETVSVQAVPVASL